jgi:hypothetical protein
MTYFVVKWSVLREGFKKLNSLAVILRLSSSVCVEISLPDRRVVTAVC